MVFIPGVEPRNVVSGGADRGKPFANRLPKRTRRRIQGTINATPTLPINVTNSQNP
jgi:hypothetical protein